jgi:hypothetical protein
MEPPPTTGGDSLAKYLGSALPPALWEKLKEGALYRPGGLGAGILTVDQEGWPHIAISSCAVAPRPERLLLPVGNTSSSLRHLERDGRCTLLVAAPGLLLYIKGSAVIIRRELASVPQEAAVGLDVTGVWSDEGRIWEMTGGLTYRFVREPAEFAALEKALLEELCALE